ncbi:hypothetical protein SRHO_G00236620 [Serrasalmus rhombeus]
MQYLLNAGSLTPDLAFATVVRHLSGEARKLVLNLPIKEQTPSRAFDELRAEYGDIQSPLDPLADFYERSQKPAELTALVKKLALTQEEQISRMAALESKIAATPHSTTAVAPLKSDKAILVCFQCGKARHVARVCRAVLTSDDQHQGGSQVGQLLNT